MNGNYRSRNSEKKDVKETWVPKTELGRKVMNGEIKTMDEIFERGFVIREPEIVDYLVPDIRDEVIQIGGNPGKGGSIRRTPIRFTNRMHKSGRRRSIHALVAVGNGNGILGLGYATSKDVPSTIANAVKKAKVNVIPIRRGCGSWECQCMSHHSLPFKTEAKCGSVHVTLMPAPKGIGLCVAKEAKTIMSLAGITDAWGKSRGQTKTRLNFVKAIYGALKKLNKVRVSEDAKKSTGMIEGSVNVKAVDKAKVEDKAEAVEVEADKSKVEDKAKTVKVEAD
ncbi:MAG: 30S ribosomal protein S5, partial [Candidatus Aenigmarchaeota archaeon]|nr:30S ribosomal protein S5 [Candidatus Aenigmarchaeota archaeon]MCK5063571.1 30S ribosomal protein S5 [Candidatus Aenigmarchaeota archaeon]MCK5234426.1 30S ribosomal protein S5 [Candidatus Aenigmarchaeota archaeon]